MNCLKISLFNELFKDFSYYKTMQNNVGANIKIKKKKKLLTLLNTFFTPSHMKPTCSVFKNLHNFFIKT